MEVVTANVNSGGGGSIGAASEADRHTVLKTLAAAFATDPVVRWVFPEDRVYGRAFPALAEAFGGGAIAGGTAFVAPDNAGAALWLPPDEAPDDNRMKTVIVDNVSPGRLDMIQALFEGLEPYHPEGPHWYLTLIGVAPERRGEGHGSALLAHALRLCDEMHLPVFLEATSERNAGLYARHGFEVMGEVRVEDSPVIRPMVRPGR